MRKCVPESGGNIIWQKRFGGAVVKVNDKYMKARTLEERLALYNSGPELDFEFILASEAKNVATEKVKGVISS